MRTAPVFQVAVPKLGSAKATRSRNLHGFGYGLSIEPKTEAEVTHNRSGGSGFYVPVNDALTVRVRP
jgi:hypothetical protein